MVFLLKEITFLTNR